MMCCNKEVSTPFCLMCGKRAIENGGPLQLLDHVRTQELIFEKIVSRLARLALEGDAKSPRHRLAARTKAYEKWRGWREFVEQAIKELPR